MTPGEPAAPPSVRLRDVALAAVEAVCAPASAGAEDQFLRHTASVVKANDRTVVAALDQCLRDPLPDDAPLVWLAGELQLSRVEILAVALAAAIEDHALLGRVLAHVQAPLGGS